MYRAAKKDDAGVRKALLEDEFTKIAVSNHQNTLLSACDSKDVLIGEAMRVVSGNGRHIVTTLAIFHSALIIPGKPKPSIGYNYPL
jgi:hypothetical protein